MIIDCISDPHGHYPKLDGGDLLIIAGDLTAKDDLNGHVEFKNWILPYALSRIDTSHPKYRKIIVIAGNHDNMIQKKENGFDLYYMKDGQIPELQYLEDSGTDFDGLYIWGSPWTKTFEGMNPKCKAFTVDTEEELAEKWAKIPEDVDILVTHGPPEGILDKTTSGTLAGSSSLMDMICQCERKYIKLHVFGHIHEAYGVSKTGKWVNASHVDENYKPVNKPIRVIL